MKALRALCLVGLAAALNTSCASALKRQCEATNWFNYGESVAQSGRRTGDDAFVKQCEGEDVDVDHAALSRGFQKGYAAYCTPESSFLLGKRGEFLSASLCDGVPNERQIKAKHSDGVREYCHPSNGVAAGASGKKYNQICPKELEGAFLPKFNEGRKRYLNIVISDSQERIQGLDREVDDISKRKDWKQKELSLLLLTRPKARPAPPPGSANANDNRDPVMEEWERNVSDQRRGINSLEGDINDKRKQQDELRNAIRDAKTEMAGL